MMKNPVEKYTALWQLERRLADKTINNELFKIAQEDAEVCRVIIYNRFEETLKSLMKVYLLAKDDKRLVHKYQEEAFKRFVIVQKIMMHLDDGMRMYNDCVLYGLFGEKDYSEFESNVK